MEDWIQKAIERQAIPKPLREETVAEFCAKHNVPVSTFHYTLAKTENQQRILELLVNKAKDSAPEILDTLVEKAKQGDMKAMDIFVDSIMKIAKNVDVKSDGKPLYLPTELHTKYGYNSNTSPEGDSEGQPQV
jgi:hypothetical protein